MLESYMQIDLEDTNKVLVELATLAARIASKQAPDLDQVQARLSFWLDVILQLFAAGADAAVFCAVISRDGDGALYKVTSNLRMAAFVHEASVGAFSAAFKRWYTCHRATNRSIPGYMALPYFDDGKVVSAFSKPLRDRFMELDEILPGLGKIPELLEAHERLGPPEGLAPFWHTPNPSDRLLRESLPRPEFSDEQLHAWAMAEVPFEFVSLKGPSQSTTGPGAVYTWLSTAPFRDPASGAMLGGPMGIRIGGVVLLRLARTIHEVSSKPERYPRAAKFMQADHLSLVAESCLECIQNDLSGSSILLEPSADTRRISNIPDIVFQDMLATPESRDMAPLSPVQGMDVSSLFFGEARSEVFEPPVDCTESVVDAEEEQDAPALGLQLHPRRKPASRSTSGGGDSRSATDTGSRVSSRAPPSSRSVAATLPALPEHEHESPPRKIRRLPPAPPTVSDRSSGDEGMADSEQSVKHVRKATAEDPQIKARPRPKSAVPTDEDDNDFFTRKAKRLPTPGPEVEDQDEIDESDEPPRGRAGARRSERTPRPVSSAPKLVTAAAAPAKAEPGPSKARKVSAAATIKSERRAAADSFAVPASDEDIFRRIEQGRETSTPAETARSNAASKKRSRSRSAVPNAGPSTQSTSGVGGVGLTSVRSAQNARGKGKGRR